MNERVVKNPNFKNNGEFHASLRARGAGAKDYPNTHTEVEYLGNGKFAASIGIGHRVFFDKADGNKSKKHKLTDERPGKDYILVQGPKCCVEVYPYYAKYFDVQHEEVRLYEERWVVQRLFAAPDDWRDVDAYNPQMAVEEYSEPAGDVVKVTVTYDTDYGVLTLEYFQRDGNALKHNVTFKNTSDSTETFRVLQRWAGIVGDKVRYYGKLKDITQEEFVLGGAFDFLDGDKPVISENQETMFTPDDLADVERQTILKREGSCNQCGDCCNHLLHCPNYDPSEPDKCKLHIDKMAQQKKPEETWEGWGARKDERCPCCFLPWHLKQMEVMPNCGFTLTPQPLKEARLISKLQPVNINIHAQGLKADFTFGNWILAQGESLEIDPDTATLDDPTEDGYIRWTTSYSRDNTSFAVEFGTEGMKGVWQNDNRGYVEWPISSLFGVTLTANPQFKYHGAVDVATDEEINPISSQPSTAADADLYADIASGVAYVDPWAFEVGESKEADLGASAKSDLQAAINASRSWFAIGMCNPDSEGGGGNNYATFYSEDKTDAANPKPTLYVEYSVGWTGKISGVTNPAKVMGVDVANIAKVKGVASA